MSHPRRSRIGRDAADVLSHLLISAQASATGGPAAPTSGRRARALEPGQVLRWPAASSPAGSATFLSLRDVAADWIWQVTKAPRPGAPRRPPRRASRRLLTRQVSVSDRGKLIGLPLSARPSDGDLAPALAVPRIPGRKAKAQPRIERKARGSRASARGSRASAKPPGPRAGGLRGAHQDQGVPPASDSVPEVILAACRPAEAGRWRRHRRQRQPLEQE